MGIEIGQRVEVRKQCITIGNLARLEPTDPVPVAEEFWQPATVTSIHGGFFGVTYADGMTEALELPTEGLPFGHRKNWRHAHGRGE